MKMHQFILCILFTTLILAGCGSLDQGEKISTKEKAFNNLYSDVNMNQLILLKDETQSFERPDRIVRLEVKNISTEKICFPIGQNITLLYFEEKNQEWVELANKTHYLSLRDEIILEPSGDLGDVSIISARPVLEINSHGKTEIRIVVWGEICEKESLQNKEGAYIDITMS